MRIDYFRVEVKQINSDNDRRQLNKLVHSSYPDVIRGIHDTLGPSRGAGGTPTDFELDASSKGIFVLKKVVERFDPWITIEGHSRLDKSDFPDELFGTVKNGGTGKHWEDAKNRIDDVVDANVEISHANHYRVTVQQFDKNAGDLHYLNELRHDFPDVFVDVHKTVGPDSADVGTPQDFSLSKNSKGIYILKKVIERFDPWITVSAVKKYDRVDLPESLFGTVEEGGIGRNWSETAKKRVDALDWP